VELRERRVGDGGALPAQVRDGDPWRRVRLLDLVEIVEVDVIGHGPFEPVQIALGLDHRPGALGGGLGECAGAEPAERRVELRRRC
jgi:hypothetical protein